MTDRVTELDYDQIKTNLKTFLQSQPEFTDYNFEGSAFSVLLNLLAYNTHYNGFYLNMAASEMFLDTAQLRESVLSLAKMLGYLPHSMKGAVAKVNVIVTPTNPEPNNVTSLTLSKYTKFVSNPINNKPYTFTNLDTYTAVKVGGSFTFSNVEITQGEVVNQAYTVLNGTKKFDIPSANVDINTLSVIVQESLANTYTTVYTKADNITNVSGNSAVYWLEEGPDSYRMVFGDNVLGKKLNDKNILYATYLDTSGDIANELSTFTALDSIGPYTSNIIVQTLNTSAAGSTKETVEEIRNRAPHAYSTQNRAVTAEDYETLLLDDYPNIDAITIWGGEQNNPPIYGKVFISMKPKENYYISLDEKERIKSEIIRNRSILTVTPEIVDPEYTYLILNVGITYNSTLLSITEGELSTLVRAAILEYRETDLKKFDSVFRKSVLIQKISAVHPAITSVSIKTILQKRQEAILFQDRIYNTSFNAPIYRGVIEDKFGSFPTLTVRDADNVEQTVYIEDTPNSFSGIDSLTITNAGSGYLYNPTVEIIGDGSGALASAKINNGRVVTITVDQRGTDYTQALARITSDTGSGATAVVNLEAKNGTLRTFYYRDDGSKIIVNSNIGTIDYQTGEINIRTLQVQEVASNNRLPFNFFALQATAQNDVIQPDHNLILDLDENDPSSIVISVEPD